MVEQSSTRDARGTRALTVLGATGSVGRTTLDVVALHPGDYEVHALTAHTSHEDLFELCGRHKPRFAVLSGLVESSTLRRTLRDTGCKTELLFGKQALLEVVEGCDTVMAAIVGGAGLEPTIHAASAGKKILLANKEALVMAGPVFMRAVSAGSAVLLPIDSEHNAVFQCLPTDRKGLADVQDVRRILLTASGGPFRTTPMDQLMLVTPEQACAHPNWVMGRKISVDSASMMNKGLEVIEARWLFGVDASRIQVVVHPQSIVHSMVEYVDGSVIAQLSNPDMRIPVAHALAYPRRIESGVRSLDLAEIGQLSFEAPDLGRFRCLALAYEVLKIGGIAPALMNAANEVAVDAFLRGRLGFTGIASVAQAVLDEIPISAADDLGCVLEADRLARESAALKVEKIMGRAA
jgi:1-deoxy-D-xylulose-5-phosphate reductoisomerase